MTQTPITSSDAGESSETEPLDTTTLWDLVEPRHRPKVGAGERWAGHMDACAISCDALAITGEPEVHMWTCGVSKVLSCATGRIK